MVVYVFGTGCQIVVENDHKLGCAASVEHTPHPLGRPSSYWYPTGIYDTTVGFFASGRLVISVA